MNGGDNKYDPNVIIQAANDKLAASDLEGGQMIFQSALLTWVERKSIFSQMRVERGLSWTASSSRSKQFPRPRMIIISLDPYT